MRIEALAATRKKAELEQFLDMRGWLWSKEISRELDDCIKTLEADDGTILCLLQG